MVRVGRWVAIVALAFNLIWINFRNNASPVVAVCLMVMWERVNEMNNVKSGQKSARN